MWLWLFADEGSPDPDASKSQAVNRPRPQPQPNDPDEAIIEGDEEDEDEVTVAGEINDVMQQMLPWMTSVLFHLGIIVLALFLVWSYIMVTEEEQPIIPVARLSENPGGQLSESEDVELQATQNVRQVQSEEVSNDQAMENLNSNTESKLELVGLSGGASGGKIAPFGTTTGTSSGIGARFYGAGGNATKIIYVIDASGSLIDTLPFVIKELKRSISELSDKQQFTVIFFQAGSAVEVPPRGWKNATSDTKKKVADWITLASGNIIPRGSTNPVQALNLAMRYRPELVFILSDNITGHGRYEVDRSNLLKMLNDANEDRKIKINTIQFLYPDPLNTLKEVAKQHGGVFKFITEDDLGLN